MHAALAHLFKDNPILRAALVAPIAMMFIFSFFNLSAALDTQRAMAGAHHRHRQCR